MGGFWSSLFGSQSLPTRHGVYADLDYRGQHIVLRPLHRRDGADWRRQRIEDEPRLRPVEPTAETSWEEAHSHEAWRRSFSHLRISQQMGIVLPAVIEVDGRFAGQLTLGNIQHGMISSCWIGYWVYSGFGGRGVATAAVAMGVDLAFNQLQLHRVEATVMEMNQASRRVLERNGFRREGLLRRNLHINGQWQDHMLVALTAEEVLPGGALRRLLLQTDE